MAAALERQTGIKVAMTRKSSGEFYAQLQAEASTPQQRKQYFLDETPPKWCIQYKKWPYDTADWQEWLTAKEADPNVSVPEPKRNVSRVEGRAEAEQISTPMFDTAFILLVIAALLVVVGFCQPLAAYLKLPLPVLLGVVSRNRGSASAERR